MKLDGWHVLALGLAMAFVVGLGFIAWKAPGAGALWPVVVTGGGAVLALIGAAFRGSQQTTALVALRAQSDAAAKRGADTIPPAPPATPRNV